LEALLKEERIEKERRHRPTNINNNKIFLTNLQEIN